MTAPTLKFNGPTANAVYITRGATYTADANGVVVGVPIGSIDINDLIVAGCVPLGGGSSRDNLTATTDPTVNSDSTVDYQVGSMWLNKSTGLSWRCCDATATAAVWIPGSSLIGYLKGANMNATTDQAVTMFVNTNFRITKITVGNASISLTTAVGGVYPAASKGGTAIVANTQVYSSLSAATKAVDLTIVATPLATIYANTQTVFLSLTTPQGAGATADLYIFGDRMV